MFKNLLLSLSAVLLALLALELYCRVTTDYAIDYYAFPQRTVRGGKNVHPYGEIPINSMGFADAEFDLQSDKTRVGYVGDSVMYGLGAGYPHRITEYMEQLQPSMLHWNIGRGVGAYFSKRDVRNAWRFKVDKLVYALNLNDIAPLAARTGTVGVEMPLGFAKRFASYFDFLRGRSYLYNRVRYALKTIATKLGYGTSGYRAIELFSSESREVFLAAGQKISQLAASLRATKVETCILFLPYEMQISADAARTYAAQGITWENGFLDGSVQRLLREAIDEEIAVFDPRPAFPEATVGSYFVHDKGDRIDFNHPNRRGHWVIAKAMFDANFCGLNPA
ncbi:MAG: hypothetical protein MJE12_21730 [Alphaproteobacteria bacterium]|nr:hypothetical protein [Alphaproteobacteria bacterium]